MVDQLYVEGRHEELTSGQLIAELDRGQAGSRHRRATVTDDATGRALSEPMRQAGFDVVPLMVMLLEEPPQAPPPGSVRVVDAETMRALQQRLMDDAGDVPADQRAEVLDGFVHVRTTIPGTRFYAGLLDGEEVSQTILYTDGVIGQPEHVMTMSTARGRGIASAVVAQATIDAVAAGCELVFMCCDAATGPFQLYAELGYRAAGRFWTFTRPG